MGSRVHRKGLRLQEKAKCAFAVTLSSLETNHVNVTKGKELG